MSDFKTCKEVCAWLIQGVKVDWSPDTQGTLRIVGLGWSDGGDTKKSKQKKAVVIDIENEEWKQFFHTKETAEAFVSLFIGNTFKVISFSTEVEYGVDA